MTSPDRAGAAPGGKLEAELIGFLSACRFDDLPPEVVDAAKREVLWTLGTSVAGSGATGSDLIRQFALGIGGNPEATALGYGDRLPASVAGFVNGCYAKALEYEDKFWIDDGHGYAIGTSVVPAAIAAAELIGGTDGRSLLTAVAVATDVQARLVCAVDGLLESGWNATYLYGALGAAMAASMVMGLDEQQIPNAVGLAYAQTCGNFQGQVEGVLGVRMQGGFGVRNGISAAQLAKLGATGTHESLTGKYGLFPLFFAGNRIDLASITSTLGTEFLGTRLGFKAYPCGAVVHPALDALRSLAVPADRVDEIVEIHAYGTPRLEIMSEPLEHRRDPRSHVEAQFSAPWAMACVLVDGDLRLAHFEAEALANPRVRALARKVHIDMAPGRRATHVEIRFSDGSTVRSEPVHAARGNAANPQTTGELVDRFRDCVRHGAQAVDESRTEKAKDLILGLDAVDDTNQIIANLV